MLMPLVNCALEQVPGSLLCGLLRTASFICMPSGNWCTISNRQECLLRGLCFECALWCLGAYAVPS